MKALHFDLSHGPSEAEYTLHVGGVLHPLQCHTEETLREAKRNNQALARVPGERITHYAGDIDLPVDAAQLLYVTRPSEVDRANLDTLMITCIHVPARARQKVLEKKLAGESPVVKVPHPKLMMCGASVTMEDAQTIIDVHDWKTAMDAAVSVVFHHSEMLNIGADTAANVIGIIEYSNGISDLANAIYEQAMDHKADPSKDNWVVEQPWKNPDGSVVEDKHRYVWTDKTKEWMVGPMLDSLKKTKNDPDLQSTDKVAGCYTIQNGITSVRSQQGNAIERANDDDYYWTFTNLTPQHGLKNVGGAKMVGNEFSTAFDNSWLRWLSLYAEFLGSDHKTPVVPEGWTSRTKFGIYESETKKYLDMLSSVNTIMAVPVGGTPITASFDWPSNASGAKFLAGGIGRLGGIEGQDGHYYGGWDWQVCSAGAIMTSIFDLGIPTIFLVAGALVSASSLNNVAKASIITAMDVARVLVEGPLSHALFPNLESLLITFADCIYPLMIDCSELSLWITGQLAKEAIEDSVPIIGWISAGLGVATDVALLAQTTAEVASSPATFEMIASRAMDVKWSLLPDAEHQNVWPREATHYVVIATYKDGTSFNTTGTMDSPQMETITVRFSKVPAGGEIKFTASFYSDTNWLCGKAATEFMPAEPTNGKTMEVPPTNIKERLIPLTKDTQYVFNNKLVYNADTGKHEWSSQGGPPTATVKNLDSSNIGHNLAKLVNITLGQETSQLGYAWQASGQDLPLTGQTGPDSGQMFTFQTIDDRSDPESGLRFVPSGFKTQPLLVYDLTGPASGLGNNFFIDPRNDEYHLRRVKLDGSTNPVDLSTGKSFGRFNQQIDACVVHPSGYAIGISNKNSKIEVLSLKGGLYDDKDAPIANMFAGYGVVPGKIHRPVGVAITPDAGMLILEEADGVLNAPARIQAFDLMGNPANIFEKDSTSFVMLKDEDQPVTYLDLAVESKSFIYVLKYLGGGSEVSDYVLDIYNPDGSYLTQTKGVSAAKMTVDLWRALYTLNFEIIEKPGDGRTEPSVCIWLPTTPELC